MAFKPFVDCPRFQTRTIAQLQAQSRAAQYEPLLQQLYRAGSPEALWETVVKLIFCYRDAFSRDLFGGSTSSDHLATHGAVPPELCCKQSDCRLTSSSSSSSSASSSAEALRCVRCSTMHCYMRMFDCICGPTHPRRSEACRMVQQTVNKSYPPSELSYSAYRVERSRSNVQHPTPAATVVETRRYNLNQFRLSMRTSDPLTPDERARCVAYSQHNSFMHVSYSSDSMLGVWKTLMHFAWRHLISITAPYHGNATAKHMWRYASGQDERDAELRLMIKQAGCTLPEPCYYCHLAGKFAETARVLLPSDEFKLALPWVIDECCALFHSLTASDPSAEVVKKETAAAAFRRTQPIALTEAAYQRLYESVGESYQPTSAVASVAESARRELDQTHVVKKRKIALCEAQFFALSGPIGPSSSSSSSSASAVSSAGSLQSHAAATAASDAAPPPPPPPQVNLNQIPIPVAMAVQNDGFVSLPLLMPNFKGNDLLVAQALYEREKTAFLQGPERWRKDGSDAGESVLSVAVESIEDAKDCQTMVSQVVEELKLMSKTEVNQRFYLITHAASRAVDMGDEWPVTLARSLNVHVDYVYQLGELYTAHPAICDLDVSRNYRWMQWSEGRKTQPLVATKKLLDEFKLQTPDKYSSIWKLNNVSRSSINKDFIL